MISFILKPIQLSGFNPKEMREREFFGGIVITVVNPSRHAAHPDQVRVIQEFFRDKVEITEPLNIQIDRVEDLLLAVKGKAWIFGSIPGPVAFLLGALAGQGELNDTLMLSFKEDRGARSRNRYAPDEMVVYQGAREVAHIGITPTREIDPKTGRSFLTPEEKIRLAVEALLSGHPYNDNDDDCRTGFGIFVEDNTLFVRVGREKGQWVFSADDENGTYPVPEKFISQVEKKLEADFWGGVNNPEFRDKDE